jgi:hypothetical protein
MTEEEHERVCAVVSTISTRVTGLVAMLIGKANLTPEQDDLVRTLLTENYRFWEVP